MESNTRYIVVVFYQGIGYTYQWSGKIGIFFRAPAVAYKRLGCAKNTAEKLGREYLHDRVCVFKTELGERISCDQYKDWFNDENRLEYEFMYHR